MNQFRLLGTVICLAVLTLIGAGCGSARQQDQGAPPARAVDSGPVAQPTDPPAATAVSAADDVAAMEITATAAVTATPTISPTVTPVSATLTTLAALNIRGGPGTGYGVLGNYISGAETTVLGVSSDGAWWRIQCPDDLAGLECWVTADTALVEVSDTEDLPMAPAPPMPTPTPTSTPVPCVVSAPAGWEAVQVQGGDVLSRIGSARGISIARIQEVNCLEDPDDVVAGATLYVPPLPEPAAAAAGPSVPSSTADGGEAGDDGAGAAPAAPPGAVPPAAVQQPAAPAAPPATTGGAGSSGGSGGGAPIPVGLPGVVQGEPPAGVAEALGHLDPGKSCRSTSAMISVSPADRELGQEFCLTLKAAAAVPPVTSDDPVTVLVAPVTGGGALTCPDAPRASESVYRCLPSAGGTVAVSTNPVGEWWWCPSPFQPTGAYAATVERDGQTLAEEQFCVMPATVPNLYVESVGADGSVTVVLFGIAGGRDALHLYSQAACGTAAANAHCYVGRVALAGMATWSAGEVHRFTFTAAGLDPGAYIVTANPDMRVNSNTLLDPQGFSVPNP